MATAIDINTQLQEYIDIIAEDENKMKKLFNYVKNLAMKRESEQPVISREDVVEGMKDFAQEYKLYREGKKKFMTWEEACNELRQEGYIR